MTLVGIETANRQVLRISFNEVRSSIFGILILAISSVTLANCTHVTIISVVIGQNPTYGYFASGPVFDVAFVTMRAKYPHIFQNITHHVVYKPEAVLGCGETGDLMYSIAGEVIQLIDQSQGFPVILSPGCSLEMIALGDVARELRVPLLATTSADVALTNRNRYPTLTTVSSSGQGQTSVAMRQFMRKNSWKVVTVLCDDLTLLPSAATFYIVSCRCIKSVLTESVGEFQMNAEAFDSTASNKPNYTWILSRAKAHSRIITIATNSDIMRRIMLIAHKLGMTNGDYAFLYPEAMSVPQTSSLQWTTNDGLDQDVLLQALRPVIVFRFPFPDWDRLASFTESVRERAQNIYNYTYASDETHNDITLSAYEAVAVLAQILNETWAYLDGQLDGQSFSNRFAGRSFDLGFRTVNIGSNGMRYRNTWIPMFNPSTRYFETTWHHEWVNNSFSVKSALASNWFGSTHLPPDVPACGFKNDRCVHANINMSVLLPVVFVLTISCLSTGLGALLMLRWPNCQRVERSAWWSLENNLLNSGVKTFSRLGVSLSRKAFRLEEMLPDLSFDLRSNLSGITSTGI